VKAAKRQPSKGALKLLAPATRPQGLTAGADSQAASGPFLRLVFARPGTTLPVRPCLRATLPMLFAWCNALHWACATLTHRAFGRPALAAGRIGVLDTFRDESQLIYTLYINKISCIFNDSYQHVLGIPFTNCRLLAVRANRIDAVFAS